MYVEGGDVCQREQTFSYKMNKFGIQWVYSDKLTTLNSILESG